jgi:internalin-related protein
MDTNHLYRRRRGYLVALSVALLLTLVSASCSRRGRTPEEPKPDLGIVTPPKPIDPPAPKPQPQPKPRFEGWTTRPVLDEQQPHLVFLTGRARGEKIRFWVDAPQDKRKNVWVDLNNNGKKDKGEEVERFGAMSYRHSARVIDAPVITIYGEVSALGCYASELSALDASGNIHLKTLSCYQNALTELRLGENSVLDELACGDNQLMELDVTRCPALTQLYVSGNSLTSLDVSRCTKLQKLTCFGNKLTTLDVSQNPSLTLLHIYRNKFAESALTQLSSSLPSTQSGELVLYDEQGDENVVSDAVIRTAQRKGWKVKYYPKGANGSAQEYPQK